MFTAINVHFMITSQNYFFLILSERNSLLGQLQTFVNIYHYVLNVLFFSIELVNARGKHRHLRSDVQ